MEPDRTEVEETTEKSEKAAEEAGVEEVKATAGAEEAAEAESDAEEAAEDDKAAQSEQSEEDDKVVIATPLEFIAAELRANTHLSATDDLRVLVMTRGRTARPPITAMKEASFYTITPAIGDRRFDTPAKVAHESAPLGDKDEHAKRDGSLLFNNAYAILACAKDCQAQAVFLCEDSIALAEDPIFLSCAYHDGLQVYSLIKPDNPAMGWQKCEPPENHEEIYTDISWRTCHACNLTFDESAFDERGLACPSCNTLARMSSDERIATLLDEGTFEEWDADLTDVDPLDFPGYADKLSSERDKSGMAEAVRTGMGLIRGLPCAFGVMEPWFFMGSMGHVVGEKISRLFDRAVERKLPVIIFCASGGARMQEGLVSLMQMAKTACARERHDHAGHLYISVLTDPTTGGVTASFATLGDIILAEPDALIGFAGKRVIQDTIRQKLPKGFQTAEFALEHGLIDAIVNRVDMRNTLARILEIHAPESCEYYDSLADRTWEGPAKRIAINGEAPDDDRPPSLVKRISDLRNFIRPARSNDPERELERHARREQRALRRAGISDTPEPGSAWERVQIARNVHRPTAQRYLDALCEGFIELHGDRAFADDAAIIAGIGWVDGQPVTIIAQEKGTDLSDRIRRNFGCPQPEGYRKAIRLMKQAEKFARPIICLVDTQGAFCGTGAEERGQGNAIAESLEELAEVHVPVVSVLLGEGGSGGALAIALANRVAMQKNAVYSVLSPEGFASILWKDGSRAPEAAEVMRMDADDIYSMGLIDAVLDEGEGPAHENPDEAVENACDYICQTLDELSGMTGDELLVDRQERFAKF